MTNENKKPKKPSERFTSFAGGFFTGGNVTVLVKGLIDRGVKLDKPDLSDLWLAPQKFDIGLLEDTKRVISGLWSDPYACIAGLLYIGCSLFQAFSKNKRERLATSFAMGTVGSGVFAVGEYLHHGLSATGGPTGLALASAYGVYAALQPKKETEEISAKEKVKNFRQNIQDVVKKHPYAPFSLVEMFFDTEMFIDAAARGDKVVMGVSALWMIGCGFLAFATKSKEEKLDSSGFKPA